VNVHVVRVGMTPCHTSNASGCASTHRVAVLVAGTFARYFTSGCEQLIAPMTQQGHSVDYYALLTTGQARSWRAGAHSAHVTYDPLFGPSPAADGSAAASTSRPSNEHIEATVRRCVEAANGTLRHFELPEAVDLDNDWRLQRELKASGAGGGDPYVRFPLPGLSARARTAEALDAAGQANRNFLRVYKALEHLWLAMEATEQRTGWQYTHTLVVRDDADWLAPMDLNRLLASRPDAHGFALSCDARVPSLQPSEINDHAMLLTRERADFLGRFYSTVILGGHARACRVQKRSGMRMACVHLRRGVATRHGDRCNASCNSEELMRYALGRAGLRIHLVGQALLPFERSSHILLPPHHSAGRTARCFHKLCQSHDQPLSLPPGRGLCSELGDRLKPLRTRHAVRQNAAKAAVELALHQAEVTREAARLAKTLPADELLSVTTIAEARVASRKCSRVAYTSVDVVGAHPLLVPPRLVSPGCTFAFVGPNVTRLPREERRFVYLSNVRSPSTRNISLRLFSKLPKLSPHILFPRKWTVFFDSKLHMRASMGELWAVYVSRVLQPWRAHNYSIGHEDIMPFTAIIHPYAWIRDVARHPCCEASRRRLGGKEFLQMGDQSAFSFMQTEARLLLTPKPKPCTQSPCVKAFKPLRVANASILRHQIKRYVALSTTAAGPRADSYHYYIDTALLMQQDAGELFGPWRAELARTDSCDRDQISFAHTTARLRLKMRLVNGCHAPVRKKTFCHWYVANESIVANVRRTDLDGPKADLVATPAGAGAKAAAAATVAATRAANVAATKAATPTSRPASKKKARQPNKPRRKNAQQSKSRKKKAKPTPRTRAARATTPVGAQAMATVGGFISIPGVNVTNGSRSRRWTDDVAAAALDAPGLLEATPHRALPAHSGWHRVPNLLNRDLVTVVRSTSSRAEARAATPGQTPAQRKLEARRKFWKEARERLRRIKVQAAARDRLSAQGRKQ